MPPATRTNLNIFNDVADVLDTIRIGDHILFNDRIYPLTVECVQEATDGYSNDAYADLAGPQGGIYQLRLEDAETAQPTAVLRRKTGYSDDVFAQWCSLILDSVDLIDHITLQAGQLFQATDLDGKSTHYEIIRNISRRPTPDITSIHLRVRDGIIRSARKGTLSVFQTKERFFEDGLKHIRTFHFGFGIGREHYYGLEKEEDVSFLTRTNAASIVVPLTEPDSRLSTGIPSSSILTTASPYNRLSTNYRIRPIGGID